LIIQLNKILQIDQLKNALKHL